MGKFNFEEWEDKKVVMHCKTEEEANEFCEVMHKAGKTWSNGVRYLERTNWENYEDQTCYFFNNGTYDSIYYSREVGYKILEWSDYSNPNSSIHIYTDGTTTTAILKDGKKTIRTEQAKCSPDDTYDFNIGAKLAFDRLMGVEPVREVKRKAKVGEWVKIVGVTGSGNKYKNGDAFEVLEIPVFGNSISAKYNGRGNTGVKGYNRIWNDEYVVLENYKPEKPIEDKPLEVIIDGVKYIKADNE